MSITKYQAEHDKKYIHPSSGRLLITAKEFIQFSINNNWIYSMHWNDDTWVEDAKVDCQHRINDLKKELNLLNKSKKILESIE